ncbi:plasmid replication protein, CyRepA1 family [Leptolyngbya sp. NK1-12]|uniref:plasmid replication protein, CyRepA1 family n=1 Tax=Leptolyngbya sp. NK1-12 TaxID=2547451 RepID=UPI00292CED00|nr:plasmid replication protein, CyRepA1 family [Leptolyngbya sp. NK1-12]
MSTVLGTERLDEGRMANPTANSPGTSNSGWIGKAAPDHAQEWLTSGVDAGIIALNVETLTDTASHPYPVAAGQYADSLFPIAERLNWTIKPFGQKPRPTLRGWWVSGIDPFGWQPMLWGRFKPDASTPVLDRGKNKPAKYLSPRWGAGSSRLILLDVPEQIWQRVAQRYGVSMPLERSQGFWHWVWQQQLPVVLTEGEKKAGCLLTLGYAAIALPGIFGGYRKTGQLIPELERFATNKRSVFICFDYDARPVPQRQITLAITKLGQLLQAAACPVQVITLPGPEKGVDDFVMAQGAEAFQQRYETALPLGIWQARQLWSLSHPAALTLNQPYLQEIPYPQSGLVCIKSAKGTGKTTALQPLIQQASHSGRKVLVITHRIQLGRAICNSIGIDWIETIRDTATHPDPCSEEWMGAYGDGMSRADQSVYSPTQLANQSAAQQAITQLGYGLCIDSLHPHSQARFNPQAWEGAIVILDEVEQVLWHALNSLTCYEHRIQILETLRELVQVVLGSGGLLIAQDADLSDVSVDYLLKLSQASDSDQGWGTRQSVTPWIVVNHWQAEANWEVGFYDTPNPAALVARLTEIAKTGAVFVALDSQKVRGRWSSKNLERYLQNQLPHKRILRIDSESVTDPDHPAYGIGERLNQEIASYDIVLATPTIGTGVSIDIRNHFKAVFGIFQGVTSDAESRQALARVRDSVPRYVWAAPFGPGKVGNGSCNYQEVVTSTTRLVKYNIALLKNIDFDIDQQTDPITLRTWAKMAARVNTSLWNFRQQLAQGLQNEGHPLTIVTADLTRILSAAQDSQHLFEIAQPEAGPETEQSKTIQLEQPQPQSQILSASTALDPEQSEQIRSDLLNGNLQVPGYEFLERHHSKPKVASVLAEISTVRQRHREQEALAISTAPDLLTADYETLKDQRSKTWQERCEVQKYELQKRYAVPITTDLKLKDEQGWFTQLRLHYYLTHDVSLVHARDYREWRGHLERGNGKVALQDVRLLTAQVEVLKGLEILNLLDPQRAVRATDADVQQIANFCIQHSQDIKTLFNLTISERMTPIEIIQALLNKLGLKLTCIRRDQTIDGRRGGLRVYQYHPPNDQRDAIFRHWQTRDAIYTSSSAPSPLTSTGSVSVSDPPLDILDLNHSSTGSTADKANPNDPNPDDPNPDDPNPQNSAQPTAARTQLDKNLRTPLVEQRRGEANKQDLGAILSPELHEKYLLMYPN